MPQLPLDQLIPIVTLFQCKMPNYYNVQAVKIEEILQEYLHDYEDEMKTIIVVGANNGDLQDFITEFVGKPKVKSILVEPVSYLFNQLKIRFADAPDISLENVAIYKKNCRRNIYRLSEKANLPGWTSGLGSLNKQTMTSHSDQIEDLENKMVRENVKCITFNHLVKKHKVQNIDVLQIDTEGYDIEILKTIDLKQLRPNVIIFEYLHTSLYQYFSIVEHLINNHYLLFKNKHSFDLIAINNLQDEKVA